MAKVYLVSTGEYSDYSIIAAFSTEELANAHCAKLNDASADSPNVLPLEIDDPDDVTATVMTRYHCCIDVKTGELYDSGGLPPLGYTSEDKVLVQNQSQRADFVHEVAYANVHYITVRSFVSREHARKLAVEARQKRLRENKK